MAKLKLDADPAPDVFLIGISSHVNDYRLCWSLNLSLGLNLGRRNASIVGQGPEHTAQFVAFDHDEAETQARISLVSNHAPEGVLLPEHRHADYFLVVDEACSLRPEAALDGVRRADFVLAAFPMEFMDIKGAYKLLE